MNKILKETQKYYFYEMKNTKSGKKTYKNNHLKNEWISRNLNFFIDSFYKPYFAKQVSFETLCQKRKVIHLTLKYNTEFYLHSEYFRFRKAEHTRKIKFKESKIRCFKLPNSFYFSAR